MTHISRETCIALDHADELAPLRNAFDLPDNLIYLDGNSLGAMPKAAVQKGQQVIQHEWGQHLIQSWNQAGWFALPLRLGNLLAPLIGAADDEVAVTDSTSINLFKALTAALSIQQQRAVNGARQRKVIVTERANFPTDIYMAEGITRWLDQGYRLHLLESPDELPDAVNADTTVLMLTQINYRTGYMHDMRRITQAAQAQGALVIWDLAHSAGAIEVDVNAANADFAVGCTYKYLNGGPGAPAFIWVPKRHQAYFQHPLSGWWSHAKPFAMDAHFDGAHDIRRALCGTQPIVSLALVETGLRIFSQTSMRAIRKKSLALSDLMIALVEQRCAAHPLTLATPREHAQRGSQVSLIHPHAYAVMQALIARGIIGDYREPGIMRFGLTPLYTRFVDLWDAVEGLRDILDQQAYEPDTARQTVT